MNALDVATLRRTHYNATLAAVRSVHADLRILRVRPDAPLPPIEPGQWVMAGIGTWEPEVAGAEGGEPADADVPRLLMRPLSISSPILVPDGSRLVRPDEEDAYEFYVTLPLDDPPAFAVRLFGLAAGERMWVAEAARGTYTLAGVHPNDDVLFASTGTGEAPHNRMIWELLRRGHHGRIGAVVTTRCRIDQAYRRVHERLTTMFPNYRYAAVATREPGESGARLQELLRTGRLEEFAGFALDPARVQVFVCGNPGMVGVPSVHPGGRIEYPQPPGMIECLTRWRGFDADAERGNIHFEHY